MNYTTHADLGGQPGHGAVVPEPEGELFHAAWEPRAMALTVAMGAAGLWNIDMSRSARETLPGYADLSYYEIWIHGLERLLRQRGLLDGEELLQARPQMPAPPLPRVLHAADVAAVLARGAPSERPADAVASPPRFAIGDAVRTRAHGVPHHTRLPGYVRGRRGTVEAVRGVHVFADTNAHGLGEQPQWLYTVVFDGRELWGEEPSAQHLGVSIDAWESYLQAAG